MFILAFTVYALDRFLKHLVIKNLDFGEILNIIPQILNITYVRNTGIAFGLFSDSGRYSIVAMNILILSLCCIALAKLKSRFITNCFYFIAFGAAGNIVDRLAYGYVIDFIDLTVIFRIPAFNLSDCMIVFAVIAASVYILKHDFKPVGETEKK